MFMFYAFSDAVQTTQLRSSSVLFQVVKAEILNLTLIVLMWIIG